MKYLVASISWLENNIFLVVYTSSSADRETPLSTNFHLITRNPQSPNSFTFQKLPEVCPSFGSSRVPPSCSMQRLKDFPPNIQDLIIVVSTASPDVGLFTRAKVPLTNEHDPQKVINAFTATTIADDARRASLPIQTFGDGQDTSCIGVALDLSSNEKVKRPLPQEEFDESSGPLPGLVILNEEGILSSWWVVYADSIRQNLSWPGLVNAAPQQAQAQAPQQGPQFRQIDTKPLATFGQPSAPGIGTSSIPTSGFPGTFGTSSGLGKPQSPWGPALPASAAPQSMTPAFGQPAFGSPSAVGGTSQGATFGTTGGIGNRVSPWGAQPLGAAGAAGSIFGQTGGLGGAAPLGGGATGASQGFGASLTNSGGFASFAKAPGFAAAAAQGGTGGSVFGKATPEAPLGPGMGPATSFVEVSRKPEQTSPHSFTADSIMNRKPAQPLGGSFKADRFQLGSTFKGDGTAANDLPKPMNSSNSLFGINFGNSLRESVGPVATTQEAQMNDNMSDYGSKIASPNERESMSPVIPPRESEPQVPETAPPKSGGFFVTQAQSENSPAAVESSVPTISSPEKPAPISTTPQDTPTKPGDSAPSQPPKTEPEGQKPSSLEQIPKSPSGDPLPPEARSKVSYAAGDSSNSSKTSAEDAPLPPDFLPAKSKSKNSQVIPPEVSALPEDNNDDRLDDDEGSGVDVAQELSPVTDPTQSPKISPESSFGALVDKSPVNELFTKVKRQPPRQGAKTLFGEVGSTSTVYPFLPPPSKEQVSPRSPSPIRPLLTAETLRPDHARSISAPGRPAKAIADRRQVLNKIMNERLPQPSQEEQRTQERDLRLSRQARKVAEEEQDLSDREDEKVREELATEVEPTKVLEPFLAHQDYVGAISKDGIPGQIEAVYRDINSMIDTLGLNARSLTAFVAGHSEFYKDGGRSLEDLQNPDWSMSEIEELAALESKLFDRLADGRITDVQGKLNVCRDMRKELHKIRSKRQDITRAISAKTDQLEVESIKSAPLDLHQSAIQNELRRDFSRFQKLLAEAEEGISMLRAKLASKEKSNGKNAAVKKPTVEAVTNTIKKMTSMIEKKNLDIDILEVQMRRLRFSPALAEKTNGETTPLRLSPSRRNARNSPRAFTPDRSNGGSTTPRTGKSSSLRKSINEVTNEEVEKYRAKVKHRMEVNAIVKRAFLDTAPRIRGLD